MSDAPQLTVVIPTLRRPDSLLRTLASLQAQDIALELLVVDNAADEALRDVIARFNASARIPARWIPEPRAGLHFARNTGANAARGALIAYTDDDVTMEPGWARAYVDAFAAHPGMAAAGGPSHPQWESPPPAWLVALVARRPTFFQLSLRDLGPSFRIDDAEPFWGLNMAMRTAVLREHGGFNPELVNGRYVGDGEIGLYGKLRAAGRSTGYVPGALVHHHIPAERMTMRYLRRRMHDEGASETYALLRREGVRAPVLLRALATNTVAALISGVAAAALSWSSAVFPLRVQLLAADRRGRAAYAWKAASDAELRRMIRQDSWL